MNLFVGGRFVGTVVYAKRVEDDWRRNASEAAAQYSQLFGATRQRIREIVAELMTHPEVVRKKQEAMPKEQSDVEPQESQMAEPGPTPPMLDQSDQERKSPDNADQGSGAGPGPGGTGGNQPGGTGVEPAPGDGEQEGDGAGEEGGGDEEPGPEQEEEESAMEDESQDLGDGGVLVFTTDRSEILARMQQPPPSGWSSFYRVAFWVLAALVILLACGWYLHVRSLNRQLALLLRQ